jgi:hypothetical protein
MEPVFAILASLAIRWLAGEHFDVPARPTGHSQSISPFCSDSIESLKETDDLSCVESIAGKHGKPVHAFFRALSVWPEYARIACCEISGMEGFVETWGNTLQEAERLASRIPMWPSECPPWVNVESMRNSIITCSEMSAEVITAATALRNGFIVGEIRRRERRGAL